MSARERARHAAGMVFREALRELELAEAHATSARTLTRELIRWRDQGGAVLTHAETDRAADLCVRAADTVTRARAFLDIAAKTRALLAADQQALELEGGRDV